jgi:hypothetical protein
MDRWFAKKHIKKKKYGEVDIASCVHRHEPEDIISLQIYFEINFEIILEIHIQ